MQQRRPRLRERHLKREFALPQTLSRLFHLFFQFFKFFWSYQSSGKEKDSGCLVFTSSTKCEIRHFHVVVVERRQRNVQKSVMYLQSYCFANINQLLFCRSSCRRRRRCLRSGGSRPPDKGGGGGGKTCFPQEGGGHPVP